MADREAAERLKAQLRVGMAAAGIRGWIHLATASGVSDTTIENWIYGRTVPRLKELRKVAAALGPHLTMRDLEAAYFDLPPEEPPLVEVLQQIAPELHELLVLMRAQADQAVLEAVRDALAAHRVGRVPPLSEPRDRPSNGTGTQTSQRTPPDRGHGPAEDPDHPQGPE